MKRALVAVLLGLFMAVGTACEDDTIVEIDTPDGGIKIEEN